MELMDALYEKLLDLADPHRCSRCPYIEASVDTVYELIEGLIKGLLVDRYRWKRACELACKHIAEVEWFSCPETDDISESENEIRTLTKQALNHFYQQAKKGKVN